MKDKVLIIEEIGIKRVMVVEEMLVEEEALVEMIEEAQVDLMIEEEMIEEDQVMVEIQEEGDQMIDAIHQDLEEREGLKANYEIVGLARVKEEVQEEVEIMGDQIDQEIKIEGDSFLSCHV